MYVRWDINTCVTNLPSRRVSTYHHSPPCLQKVNEGPIQATVLLNVTGVTKTLGPLFFIEILAESVAGSVQRKKRVPVYQ